MSIYIYGICNHLSLFVGAFLLVIVLVLAFVFFNFKEVVPVSVLVQCAFSHFTM